MIEVKIDQESIVCDCCGKSNLKRTIKIMNDDDSNVNLGVTCAGNRFNLNLSGNPFHAARRLEEYINSMDNEDYQEILEEIKEDNLSW